MMVLADSLYPLMTASIPVPSPFPTRQPGLTLEARFNLSRCLGQGWLDASHCLSSCLGFKGGGREAITLACSPVGSCLKEPELAETVMRNFVIISLL